jgi:hypothetical protein
MIFSDGKYHTCHSLAGLLKKITETEKSNN